MITKHKSRLFQHRNSESALKSQLVHSPKLRKSNSNAQYEIDEG